MVKFSDYFNSTTTKGRANVAKATYASFAAIYIYNRFKKSKKNTEERPKNGHKEEENYNQNVHVSVANGNGSKHFICPRCDECNEYENGEEAAANNQQNSREFHDPKLSSKNNYDSAKNSPKSENTQDHASANGEAIIKSSKSKSFYGGTHGNKRNHKYSDSPPPDTGSCR